MNLDPRTIVILTVLSTMLMSISLFVVARGYLSQMRGVTRWAIGTLLQSIGWILLATIGLLPAYIAELGSPFIMLGLAFYYHSLVAFKGENKEIRFVYIIVLINLFLIYMFLYGVPDMSARIVVASGTGSILMFLSARLLFSGHINRLPVSHVMMGFLFAICSLVLLIRAVYYLVWNTVPDQSAFEQNIIQDIAFLTFFLAGVVSPFTFLLMCNDRYSEQSMQRTRELASMNDELIEAGRAKGQFLATMSHEIRTPMNGVIGFLNQLSKTRLDTQQRDYLDTINVSARMLLSVINDVLDYSKIDAGKFVIEKIPVDIRRFIDDTLAMFSANAEEKGLELISVVDHRIPVMLQFDPVRLTQILSNLIGNAIKFTEKGRVQVRVTLLESHNGEYKTEFSVSDTGIGISQLSLGKLFQPFMQADASTTRKYGGTGLGLVIAKKLVEMMGGYIRVESEMWKGTEFRIMLPLSIGNETADIQRSGLPENLKFVLLTRNETLAESAREVLLASDQALDEVNSVHDLLAYVGLLARQPGTDLVIMIDIACCNFALHELCEDIASQSGKSRISMALIGSAIQANEFNLSGLPFEVVYVARPLRADAIFRIINGNANSEARKDERGRQPDFSLRNRKILIVDDNQINMRLMQIMVSDLGGDFDGAENGMQAVDACARKQYDLVLMDINMPVMDGPEAVERIRKLESSSRHTVIVALTANSLPGDREKYLSLGFDDYLNKPVGESAFAKLINKWLRVNEVPDTGKMVRNHDANISDQAIFDPELGIKLSLGDKGTWNMVMELLVADLPDFQDKIERLTWGERQQISILAHKLAGSSCYSGTPALYQASKRLEVCCIQCDEDNFEKLHSEVILQIRNLRNLANMSALHEQAGTIYSV